MKHHTKSLLPLLCFSAVSTAQTDSSMQNFQQLPVKHHINEKALRDSLPKTEEKSAFLKIQGNIVYNFTYQSYVDTPFTQKGLLQHLTQVSLNATINV